MSRLRDDFLTLCGAQRWGRLQSLERSDAIRFAAIMPVLLFALWNHPADLIGPLVLTSLLVLGAQGAFSSTRGRRMDTGGLFSVAAIVLLLPADVPVTHLVLGAVFGIVLGELIFGGRGFGFLNPAIVGLAFVYFSIPAAAPPAAEINLPLAALCSAVVLGCGLADWRVTVAATAVFLISTLMEGNTETIATGAGVLVTFFLVADPAIVPLARGARYLVGFLFAFLALLLPGEGAELLPRTLVFAALLASIFGPLLDTCVLALQDTFDRFRRRA